MFFEAISFNQDISHWTTSNLTNVVGMFENATKFNQNISNWSMENVIDMESMFADAVAFNQDISAWNVTSVVNFQNMSHGATAFRQNLCPWRSQLNTTALMDQMLFGTNCPNQTVHSPIETMDYFCELCAGLQNDLIK